MLFLESFAPLVNSLNLGIASPLVLGPPPFQLAHIKTQLALQQLTASSSAPPHASFGRAVLKSAMFSPRGALPQRPRGPNPSAAKPPGSFQGVTGPQRPPAPGAPRGAAPRASGQDSVPWTGSQRINVRVTLHRADPRQAKAKGSLHQEQKGDVRAGRWDGSPCPPPPVVSQKPPARIPEQNAAAQNRYTPESASSILASFGLSNEDLEELSRYPDDQLTPENMPLILREIRMRKMGQPLPGLHSQSRGEAMSGTSGAAVKGKVIDYGHASKYGYTEDPLEVRGYNVEALREEPLEARPYNPEAPGGEKREEFHREQSVPMGVPPAGVACGPAFPPQDVMKPPPAFQSDPANPHPFFPAEPAGKAGGLCAAPVGKAGPPPAVLPVMPPILPLAVPPMAQPVVPPLISQPVVPVLPQPPFSAELLAILEQRDRIQHEAGSSQPSAQSSGMGQKPFQPQPEGPIKSPFGVVKASWLPSFLQSDSQKIKRLPTPSMMNDYYATSPRIFPHMCSLCNVECARMKVSVFTAYCRSCTQLLTRCSGWGADVLLAVLLLSGLSAEVPMSGGAGRAPCRTACSVSDLVRVVRVALVLKARSAFGFRAAERTLHRLLKPLTLPGCRRRCADPGGQVSAPHVGVLSPAAAEPTPAERCHSVPTSPSRLAQGRLPAVSGACSSPSTQPGCGAVGGISPWWKKRKHQRFVGCFGPVP